MSGNTTKKKRRGERADGRVLLTLIIGKKENGKPERKYFYGNTREEANRKREQYKRERSMGLSDKGEKMTVEEWIDIWYERYKPNANASSSRTYQVLMKRLKKDMGERLIRKVSESDLQQSLSGVAGMSMSMINKYQSFIHQVFSRAAKNRLILFDPSDGLSTPEGSEGTHRALDRWESDFIMAHWKEHRAGLWAMLMLLLGIRRGEMVALDWADIDMDKRVVNIHRSAYFDANKTVINDKTKTYAGMRMLPICQPLFEALDAVPSDDRSGFVCTSVKGDLLTESAFKRGWNGFNTAMQRILNKEPVDQQGRRTDLEDQPDRGTVVFSIRAHDLRHTFATALYDAGISVKAAQYYLGHSDLRMTLDLYTHLSVERENRERSELTGFLDAWIKPVELKTVEETTTENKVSEVETKEPESSV